ncbi:hypothetical protein BK669_04335 [Pseudomonas fluorescens]|nr:hypothetical protein BK669_04335 [Pseudomonas fluorescens]
MIAPAWFTYVQSPAAMSGLVSVRTEGVAGPALEWAISAMEGDQQPTASPAKPEPSPCSAPWCLANTAPS